MGLNDATEYFKALQNDFLCALTVIDHKSIPSGFHEMVWKELTF